MRLAPFASRSVAVRLLIGLAVTPLLLAPAIGHAADGGGSDSGSPDATPQKVVFLDTFDGPQDGVPDLTKWTYDIGNQGGWGNHEWESYTAKPENSGLDGKGHLRITALRTRHLTDNGFSFTSARLKTISNPFMYGRAEARIKVPAGQGLWPAFWMLGISAAGLGWPNCGEIDVMEATGRKPNLVYGAVHGPVKAFARGSEPYHHSTNTALPRPVASDWHTFTVDSSPGHLRWYVDGRLFQALDKATFPPDQPWVYDRPFQLLLNLAIGGEFAGAPTSLTRFPASMLVDYVRVTTTAS